MGKVGFVVVGVGSLLAVACGGAPGDESTAQTSQAMCAANSDTCGPDGYPVRPGPKTLAKTLGTCAGRPGNVTSTSINDAVANPVSGWAVKNTSDLVWNFEDHIVRAGYVAPTDQMYFIAPNGTTGQAWLGLQISADAYATELGDAYVTSLVGTFPVLSHVVQCNVSSVDPDTGDTTTTTTYWSIHDPGGCTKTSCALSSAHAY